MKVKTYILQLLGAALILLCSAQVFAQSSAEGHSPSSGAHPKSNLTLKEWNVDPATGSKVLDHVTIYNEAGRKIEECEYDGKGLKWRKVFELGSDGVLVREKVYNSANKLDNIRKFEFDEHGRKKTEYIYDAKGKLKKYKIYEYSSSGNR